LGGYSDGDASGDKTENSRGGQDYWILQTDRDGNRLWDKTYGGNGNDELQYLVLLSDGHILLIGHSQSGSSGEKSDDQTGVWILKIDPIGNITWDKTFDFDPLIKGVVRNEADQVVLVADVGLLALDTDGEVLWSQQTSYGEGVSQVSLLPEGGLLLANESGEIFKTDAQGNLIQSFKITPERMVSSVFLYPDGQIGFAGIQGSLFSVWINDWWFEKYSPDGHLTGQGLLLNQGDVETASFGAALKEVQVLDDGGLLLHGNELEGFQLARTYPSSLRAYLVDAQKDSLVQELVNDERIDPQALGSNSFAFVIKSGILNDGSLDVALDGPISASKS
ncbi:MAG: hypothetical protein AAFU64_21155, partial [Bacteroidota bacterium]